LYERGSSALRELAGARELLRNLTSRELKVRYKRSTLGFLWTLLNPLLMMAVFTLVFSTAFKTTIEWFPVYFLSGYLPFAFFQASVMIATGSIVGNAGLITKVYFPRAVLPLSVVASQLVHLLLGIGVLLGALVVLDLASDSADFDFVPYLPVLVLAIVLLAAFAMGMALLFSAGNTFLRDIGEFLPVGFLLWFYATPVIYQVDFLPEDWRWVLLLNPLTYYVQLFRDALYDPHWPAPATVAAATVCAAVSLVVGWTLFVRLSERFAKEV
jgi:ABC-type polysaccharide/polyol phosphate export permease